MDIEEKIRSLREMAEVQLGDSDIQDKRSNSKYSTIEELLYEIEVQQTELEIQNEELRSTNDSLNHTIAQLNVTNDELKQTEKDLRELYESAPVAYFTLDHKGTISNVNTMGAKLLQSEVALIKGVPLSHFCDRGEADKLHRYLVGLNRNEHETKCEVRLKGNQGRCCDVLLQGYRVANNVDELRITVTDLTDRKQAERERAWLSSLVMASDEAIVGLDAQGRITSWNPGAVSVFGYTAEETADWPISELLALTSFNRESPLVEGLRHARHCQDKNLACTRKDSECMLLSVTLSPIFYSGELNGFALMAIDITEERRLESEILSIAEWEQCRFGRDLHDSIGQQLFGIHLMIDELTTKLKPVQHALASKAKEIGDIVRQTSAEARALSHGYAVSLLESEGLKLALEKLAEQVREYSNVTCRCQVDEGAELDDLATATHLYRIAQEAVTNAIRHGLAEEVELELTASDGWYRLSIRDNGIGIGFDTQPSSGIGLRVMHYRAKTMNGTLEIKNRPEGGTMITCTVPG